MQTYNSVYERELAKGIAALIETYRDHLEGQPHQGYDFVRGQIHALRQMDSLMEDAAKAAKQENR